MHAPLGADWLHNTDRGTGVDDGQAGTAELLASVTAQLCNRAPRAQGAVLTNGGDSQHTEENKSDITS